MRRNSTTTIFGVLLIIMLLTTFVRDYMDYEQPLPKVITNTVTKWDTVKVDSIVYKPQWKTRWRTKWDTFTVPVDTQAILDDYYTIYTYQDTQKLDSLILVVEDTVTQNKIKSRSVSYQLLYPTTTIKQTEYIYNNGFYYGLDVAGRSSQLDFIGAGALYKTKGSRIYGLGLGINRDFEPVVSAKIYWQFSK